MPQRKPYNPNTAYGRKKIREEFQRRYANMSEQEKKEFDKMNNTGQFIWFVIAIIICIIVIALGGKIR